LRKKNKNERNSSILNRSNNKINEEKDCPIRYNSKNKNILNNINNRCRSCSKNFSDKDSEIKLKDFNSSSNTFKMSKSNRLKESYLSMKDRIELTKCTFKPKINENSEYTKIRNNDVFNKLYTEMDRINIRKLYKKIQIDMIESAKASFSPDLSCSYNKNNKYFSNSKSDSKKFFDRMEDVK